jgi:hypothetical protein
MRIHSIGPIAGVLLCLAGCSSAPPKRVREPDPPPQHPATAILLAYAAPDGSLTRVQMETGLRRDFDKLDANHSGCLDENEVRAVNEARWKADASTASPLIDFKHNGCVDFDEFAATARSLFDMIDRDGTGKLSAQQLKPGAKKPAQPANNGQGEETRHRHGGGPSSDA